MKAIFILLLLTIAAHAFCQQTGRLNKPGNLQKSKHQKTAAWIMLGGGFALAAGGVAVDVSNWYSSGGCHAHCGRCLHAGQYSPIYCVFKKQKESNECLCVF